MILLHSSALVVVQNMPKMSIDRVLSLGKYNLDLYRTHSVLTQCKYLYAYKSTFRRNYYENITPRIVWSNSNIADIVQMVSTVYIIFTRVFPILCRLLLGKDINY